MLSVFNYQFDYLNGSFSTLIMHTEHKLPHAVYVTRGKCDTGQLCTLVGSMQQSLHPLRCDLQGTQS